MKKKVTTKTATGRDKKGQFIQGNKVKELWNAETVQSTLEDCWKTLTNTEGKKGGTIPPDDGNIVRANDIKLLGEVCLMHGISKQRFSEWTNKFTPPTIPDDKGQQVPNPHFSEPVAELIKNIKWLLECRLVYSGGTMDIFTLKTHYEGYDQPQQINTKVTGDIKTTNENHNTGTIELTGNPFLKLLQITGQVDEQGNEINPFKKPAINGKRKAVRKSAKKVL